MNTMPVVKRQAWSYGNLLLGVGDEMESLKVLEANLGHVQRDVAEIKGDQRSAGVKLDGMNGRLDTLRDKIDHVGSDVNRHIDDVSARLDGVTEKVVGVRTDLTSHLDTVRKELTAEVNALRTDVFQKIDVMRGELFAVKSSVAAAKVWTLSLQLTIAAGLLAVMAHGFKWI